MSKAENNNINNNILFQSSSTENVLLSQINKIFLVIEKNQENKEISKIAYETLNSKCLENPILIIPILNKLINLTKKGNLKFIEESHFILINFFEDFSEKILEKILKDEFYKNKLIEIYKKYFIENNKNVFNNIFFINYENFEIEKINELNFVDFDLFEKFDIKKIKDLVAEEKNNNNNNNFNLNKLHSEEIFNNYEMKILFNDDIKKEFEKEKNIQKTKSEFINFDNINNEDDNKINIENFYDSNKKIFKFNLNENLNENLNNLNENFNNNLNNENKIRKISENSKIINFEIKLNPFFLFINSILKFNHKNFYNQRLCAITILHFFKNFFKNKIFTFFPIQIFIEKTQEENKIEFNLNEIKISNNFFIPQNFIQIYYENFITQLILNSLKDNVIDYNDDCLFLIKEMDIQLSSKLLESEFISEEKRKKLFSIILNYLKKFKCDNNNNNNENNNNNNQNEIKNEWTNLYSILLFYKYIFLTKLFIYDKKEIFENLIKNFDSSFEDIINLIIQIFDKILEYNLENNFLNFEIIEKFFLKFTKILKKYDDIESGVKYYLNCLYNFINFFIKDNNIKIQNKIKIFNELSNVFDNNFLLHSMNKISQVRIKYFEVLNNLLNTNFKFNFDFLEKNIIISFQGLCIEENKKLLNIIQQFLINCINNYNEKFFEVFIKYQKNFFNLLLKKNYKNIDDFFIPKKKNLDENNFEIEELYKSFFKDDLETNLIEKKFEQKIYYLTPIFAFILTKKIQFIEILKNNLNFQYENLILSSNLLIFLKIYFYYLEYIEFNKSHILILNDQILLNLCEINYLNDMKILITNDFIKNNIYNLIKNFESLFINEKNENFNFSEILNNILQFNLLNIFLLNQKLKFIFENFKNNNNNNNFEIINDKITKIKNFIKNNLQFSLLKQKIRGYSSICYFIHCMYNNTFSNTISSITNSFLNGTKLNNKECKIFVKYLLRLISILDNNKENKEKIKKIIFKFIENGIDYFKEKFGLNFDEIFNENYNENNNENNNKNNEINDKKNYYYKSIKYFFGEYSLNKKFTEIQNIFSDYINELKTKKDNFIEIKIIIFLFLLTNIKTQTKILNFKEFCKILKNKKIENFLNFNENFVTLILSDIFIKGDLIFQDFNTNLLLDFLFNSLNNQKIFYFNLILSILIKNEKIRTASIDYIFLSLKHINNKNEKIRKISTQIFSNQMKIISILKFDNNYEELNKNTHNIKSLEFINKIFSQEMYDIKELKIKIKIKLRNYQLNGINWLLFLGSYGLGLALCDDMGLGKTIQTLVCIAQASIEYKKQNKKNPISLIICPTTLILNWIMECKKFFDENEITLKNVEDVKNVNNNSNNKIIIFISSYEKARENNREFFTKNDFFYLVLDEAHIIKNSMTKTYQAIKKINSERRIILTGTPIQNNVMELWSLFNFLMPGFLGSENDFEIKYHKKMHDNIKKLNLEEKFQENIFQTSLREIKKRIKPFILRRLKSEVLQELPEKIIADYPCQMTEYQQKLYDKINNLYENPKKKTNNNNNISNINNKNTLALIDKLRKICNHPSLLGNQLENNININNENFILNNSGKFNALEELLISLGFENYESHNNNNNNTTIYENKVLIFTQFKQMIYLISTFLKKKFPSIFTIQLTSDVKPKERSNIVLKFNNDPTINIMILTTSIGGLGLNLTAANIVIMYDHNWNPSKDMQAIDRAHRLGQKKTVNVYRLITVNSIEEKLINLQTFKTYIANNVVDINKMGEKKISTDSVMMSFEEFSKNKIEEEKKGKVKKKKMGKLEELMNVNEEEEKEEEMQIEYLKHLIKNEKII